LLAVVLALVGAVSYGAGDFMGGVASRRAPVLTVVVVSQALGFAAMLCWALLSGDAFPDRQTAAAALAGGAAGMIGLSALYRGFAVGAMGIVAPISAAAPVVVLAWDLAHGVTPSAAELLGLVLVVGGVAIVSREPGTARVASGVALALLAAVGFGFFFIGLESASSDGGVPWAVALARAASTSLGLIVVLGLRARIRVERPVLPLIVGVAVFDTGANALIAAAYGHGDLTPVTVLAALYPVVVVALAHVVLHERLHRVQLVGAAVALAGAALVAAG
jgi:drug/metabolite transporter (DMT)-like permease